MRKHNPFTPGYGEEPPYLAGRETEQSALTKMLHRTVDLDKGKSVVMYGPRGTGKTVLLNWFEAECNEAGAVTINATPAGDLESSADLPRLLLPQSRLPDEVSVGLTGVLSMEWKNPDTEPAGKLSDHLIAACRKTPRVLLLDEAHTLDPKTCRSLLTLGQKVAAEAPFLLVLTGTPGLQPFLMSVGATFVERSQKLAVGRLDEQGAAEAINIPLQQDGISIEEAALSRAVKDAQCYPYFLQLWGSALWDAAAEHDADRLTNVDVEQVMPKIVAHREGFYKSRYNLLRKTNRCLRPLMPLRVRFAVNQGLPVIKFQKLLKEASPIH